MKLIDQFILEYKQNYLENKKEYEDSITGRIKKIKDLLLDEKYQPSLSLQRVLDKLIARSKEPMKVAVTGQFSSGKSTFLNALISRKILPTGITPVTSKVNFIKYGKEFRLKITYNNGTYAYCSIEDISKYTDQRSQIEDIKYLSLYAPLPILKEIIFVDTPGLNSQSHKDTETTNAILRDVDGIIWLSLIDNAGKMSEAKILEQYLYNYQNKSLCVLNQKDRFENADVEKSVAYVKEHFGKYFADVIAISASWALESRVHQKEVQKQELVERFKKELDGVLESLNKEQLVANFETLQKQINALDKKELMEDFTRYHQSNIQSVLDFIDHQIRPKALDAKEYSIKNDLRNICDLLIEQNYTLVSVFEKLEIIIKKFQPTSQDTLAHISKIYSDRLLYLFNSFESIVEKISHEIYRQIKPMQKDRYEESKKSIFKKSNISKHSYEIAYIDSDAIYKNLFYDDETIAKLFKKITKELGFVSKDIEKELQSLYEMLAVEVKIWQNPYELLRKSREIASDIEFANIRKFASKAYENILYPLHGANLQTICDINKEFSFLNGIFLASYQNATKVTVAFFKRKITQSAEIYESDPQRFALYSPSLEEISSRLKINFSYETIESMLKNERNFIGKNLILLQELFDEGIEQKVVFVEEYKAKYLQNIKELEDIKSTI